MRAMLSEDEKALVIALTRERIMNNECNLSWTPSYTRVRWSHNSEACVAERIGGLRSLAAEGALQALVRRARVCV